MNSMEEQLWEYLDGGGTPAQRRAIEDSLAHDVELRQRYDALKALSAELAAMELDEPSMAFTYNVMQGIREETARQPLKAAINKRIILSITAFFLITITALLVFALTQVNWTEGSGIKMPEQLNITHVKSFFSGPLVQGFLFFDVVMGLYLLDTYLRKRNSSVR